MKKEELIPPDPEQCQCETRIGNFMTFGPPQTVRCKNGPVVIVTEKKKPCGSMSLCGKCYEIALKQLPKNSFITTLLGSTLKIKVKDKK